MSGPFAGRIPTERVADWLRSKGFIPGGEVVIDGEWWAADEITAHSQVTVDWGTCNEREGSND